MKKRYVLVTLTHLIWHRDRLKAQDFAALENGYYIAIIDTEEGAYYDLQAKDWLLIC